MSAYIIQSGHFSKAGNFMGFSTKGERIHIYRKDILKLFPKAGIVYRCLGTYENELIKFPFYCLADENTFDHIDFDGNKTGEKFTRLTAIEIRDTDYEIKVAAVNNYDYTHPYSSYNNDHLIDENKKLKWDLEYSQSERERLELLCKEHEVELQEAMNGYHHAHLERERLQLLCDELWQYRKAFDALKSLTSYQLDQLINNV
jgi:hypothetical protein